MRGREQRQRAGGHTCKSNVGALAGAARSLVLGLGIGALGSVNSRQALGLACGWWCGCRQAAAARAILGQRCTEGYHQPSSCRRCASARGEDASQWSRPRPSSWPAPLQSWPPLRRTAPATHPPPLAWPAPERGRLSGAGQGLGLRRGLRVQESTRARSAHAFLQTKGSRAASGMQGFELAANPTERHGSPHPKADGGRAGTERERERALDRTEPRRREHPCEGKMGHEIADCSHA